jgi:hypothetical protein
MLGISGKNTKTVKGLFLRFTNRPVQNLLLKLINRYAINIRASCFGDPHYMKLAISFEADKKFSNFLKLLNVNQNLIKELSPEQLKKILGHATIKNVSRHLAIKRLMVKSS